MIDQKYPRLILIGLSEQTTSIVSQIADNILVLFWPVCFNIWFEYLFWKTSRYGWKNRNVLGWYFL